MMRASRRSSSWMSCSTPLLPRNENRDLAAIDRHVSIAQRRQPERAIVSRVFVVADADQGLLQKLHDRGEHFLARQFRVAKIACRACTYGRQRLRRTRSAGDTSSRRERAATSDGSDTVFGRAHRGRRPEDVRGDRSRSRRPSRPAVSRARECGAARLRSESSDPQVSRSERTNPAGCA